MLSVENIAAEYDGRVLFRGVSFTLAPGDALALRGRNGAGKTTLLRTLAGLRPPLEGALDYFVETTLYIGHRDALTPSLTPAQILQFWASVFGIPPLSPERRLDMLATFQLDARADDMCADLSVGQLKRLSLCRLLLFKQKVWLLDEPLSGLDSAGGAILERLITAHLQKGGIVVAATHIDIPAIKDTLDLQGFIPDYRPQKETA